MWQGETLPAFSKISIYNTGTTMSNASEIREHLYSLNTRGIKYDLDRIREAAHRCGNPQNFYKSFHVAGTNGKGSTCTYIESVLRAAGNKTGLYTSPHIVDFEERFLINGIPVTEDDWLDIYETQKPVIDDLKLTFFEATTLMAFELFKRNGVNWAVFETGLGGRLDATNIIVPQAAVVTGIAMDHTEYLGSTLLAIAHEKLGIVKPQCPLVFAESSNHAIVNLAERTCSEKNAPLHIVSAEDASEIDENCDGIAFTWKNERFQIPMRGKHQVTNALLALNALQCAGFTDIAVQKKGLAGAFLPGRFQIVKQHGRTIVFDVGHNPDAASVVVRTIRKVFNGKKVCIVTGIMKDKDTRGILEYYCSVADHIICAKPSTGRAASSDLLIEHCGKENAYKTETAKSVADAIKTALSRPEDIVCITGSFYTVGEGFEALGLHPYAER